MSGEEAIRIAQGLITNFKCESETMVEFCNVVIEALEQMNVLDKIRAEIEQLPITEHIGTHKIYIDAEDFKENVLAIIDKYKGESENP